MQAKCRNLNLAPQIKFAKTYLILELACCIADIAVHYPFGIYFFVLVLFDMFTHFFSFPHFLHIISQEAFIFVTTFSLPIFWWIFGVNLWKTKILNYIFLTVYIVSSYCFHPVTTWWPINLIFVLIFCLWTCTGFWRSWAPQAEGRETRSYSQSIQGHDMEALEEISRQSSQSG